MSSYRVALSGDFKNADVAAALAMQPGQVPRGIVNREVLDWPGRRAKMMKQQKLAEG